MSESFVPGLSATTPPPPPTQPTPPPTRPASWKYKNWREGQPVLNQCEQALGLPPSKETNIGLMNRKIDQYQTILANFKATGTAKPVPSLSGTPSKPLEYATPPKRATHTATAPAVQSTPEPTRPGELPMEKLRALGASLFHLPVTASRERVIARLHLEGVVLPGIPAAKHTIARSGFDLAVQSQNQKKADAFLSKNS